MKLGVHVSALGGLDRAAARARRLGCETFQVFVKSNRQWATRPLRADEAAAFRRQRSARTPVFAHACYLVNLATGDAAVRERSVAALSLELARCTDLQIDGLVVHPGSHRGGGAAIGLERILRSTERVLARVPGAPRLLLESTAGQGTSVGSRLEELAWLLDRTSPDRVGICLDTCHLHAAGYRLDTAGSVRSALEAIEATIGWQRIALWHLNDSRAPAGSRRDRHAGIGDGTIGRRGFAALLSDQRVRKLPGILETPKGDGESLDRRNLARLRALVRRPRPPIPGRPAERT